jgi:hypothetical protein
MTECSFDSPTVNGWSDSFNIDQCSLLEFPLEVVPIAIILIWLLLLNIFLKGNLTLELFIVVIYNTSSDESIQKKINYVFIIFPHAVLFFILRKKREMDGRKIKKYIQEKKTKVI